MVLDLLDVSESLTDNAKSIRRIMNDGYESEAGTGSDTEVEIPRKRSCRKARTLSDTGFKFRRQDVMNRMRKKKSNKIRSDEEKWVNCAFPEDEEDDEEPEFLSQFKPMTFDAVGDPSAANEAHRTRNKFHLADLERSISYQGGWTEFDRKKGMIYDAVPEDEIIIDATPNYRDKGSYGLEASNLAQHKNELFSGRLRGTWQSKTENKPFFEPSQCGGYEAGMPCITDFIQDRMIVSNKMDGVSAVQSEQVTPGLGLKAHEKGRHGYHDMYRVREKTVDELRVRPKVTYAGRIVNGMFGHKGAQQAPVISRHPRRFKKNSRKDMLPIQGDSLAPNTRDSFIMRPTNRAETSQEYTGQAYVSSDTVGACVPEYMRPKFRESRRQNFKMPKPLHKFSREEAVYNQNLQSYNLAPTQREMALSETLFNVTGPDAGHVASQDELRPTIKMITAEKPTQTGILQPNTMYGTARNMDSLRTTARETTCINPLNGNITAPSRSRTYNADIPRPTIKETTLDGIVPANIVPTEMKSYTQLQDRPKTRIQETTEAIARPLFVSPDYHGQTSHLMDTPRTRISETTEDVPRSFWITPVNKAQKARLMDSAKTTMRELQRQHPMKAATMDSRGSLRHQDRPKTTQRETTIGLPRQLQFNTGTNVGTCRQQDSIRTTLREATMHEVNPRFAHLESKGIMRYQDELAPTMRETTEQKIRPLRLETKTRAGVIRPDAPKTTLRELTEGKSRSAWISGTESGLIRPDAPKTTLAETLLRPSRGFVTGNQRHTTQLTDRPRTTLAETRVSIPRSSWISPITSGTIVRAGDKLRPTLRETTVGLARPTQVTMIGQNQGAASSFDRRPLRTTQRELTEGIQRPKVVTGAPAGRIYSQDAARPTLRGNVAGAESIGPCSGENKPTVAHTQPLRTTMREMSVINPTMSNVTAGREGATHTANRDALPTTLRELTVQNHRVNAPYEKQAGTGYMIADIELPETNRQYTCQEVYVAPVVGNETYRSRIDVGNAHLNDKKECVQIYRAPTNSGPERGRDQRMTRWRMRNDNHQSREPNSGYIDNPHLQRPKSRLATKCDKRENFIDDSILKQLSSNPYHIDVSSHSNF